MSQTPLDLPGQFIGAVKLPGKPASKIFRHPYNYLLAAGGLLIGIAISIVLFMVSARMLEDRAHLLFENQATKAQFAIQSRVEDYASILNGLSALFQTSDSISRIQFRRYFAGLNLQQKYPGIKNINFARQISADEKAAFEAGVRQDRSADPAGYPNFSIQPAGERAAYHVRTFIEPMPQFLDAFGLDIASVVAPAKALESSRDSGKPIASGRLIPRKTGKRAGLAMRLPIYQRGMPLGTVEQRRAAYRGSVGAGFDVEQLMAGVLDNVISDAMQVKVYDTGRIGERREIGTVNPEHLLFDNHTLPQWYGASDNQFFTTRLPLEVGGHVWEIALGADKMALQKEFNWYLPWFVLAVGLLVTLLLLGNFYALASAHRRANEIANLMTRDLRASEASLADAQQIAHLGNWLFNPASEAVTCSVETCRILNLDQAQGERHYSDFTAGMSPDDRSALRKAFDDSLSSGREFAATYRIASQEEMHKWVQIIARPRTDALQESLRGTVMDVSARMRVEEALQTSLQEKEALLKEVHHRVKNNLQVVNSLLRLESGRSTQDGTRSVLADMQGRIRSMALLHESLYRSGMFSAVDLGTYLKQLTTQAFRAQVENSGAIRLHLDLASIQVGMELATPCGLLVNELLSNCLKHGFSDGRGGEVRVELQALEGGTQICLRVSDTGIGLPPDFAGKTQDSLGLQLVADLVAQIDGKLEIEQGPTTAFVVRFAVDQPKSASA